MGLSEKITAYLYELVETKKNNWVLQNLVTKELVVVPAIKNPRFEKKVYVLDDEKKLGSESFKSRFMKAYKIETFFLNRLHQADYDLLHECLQKDLISDHISKNQPFKNKQLDPRLKALAEAVCYEYYNLKEELKELSFKFLSKDAFAVEALNIIAKEVPLIKENFKYTYYRPDKKQNKADVVKKIKDFFLMFDKEHKYNISVKI